MESEKPPYFFAAARKGHAENRCVVWTDVGARHWVFLPQELQLERNKVNKFEIFAVGEGNKQSDDQVANLVAH